MNHVYFFVELSNPMKIDFDDLPIGNPGIGGTQYATICLALELSRRTDLHVELISPYFLEVPQNMGFHKLESLSDAIDLAESNQGILVFRPTINLSDSMVEKLYTTKANLIAWTHVTPSQKTLRFLSQSRQVRRVVALGKRQLLGWLDNPVSQKTVVIKNGQYIPSVESNGSKDHKYVTYLGSMVPQKGFHLLAEVWPQIHELNPSLRLKVIGSGNLYDANAKLGDFGIASSEYEFEFLRNLGESLSSVDFLGKIDSREKNAVIADSYLGIVNPSGYTEICPASALDFQALKVPVISVRKFGLIDTVKQYQTGILVKNYTKIPSAINYLIENENLRNEMSLKCTDFLIAEFNYETIVEEWYSLISNLVNDTSTPIIARNDLLTITDRAIYLNFNLRSKFPMLFSLPSVVEVSDWVKKIIKKILLTNSR
jgi:glycosyltransferase involved in cell wall biosynthesis